MTEVDALAVVKSYREQSESCAIVPQLAPGLTSDENEVSRTPQTVFDRAFCDELLSALGL